MQYHAMIGSLVAIFVVGCSPTSMTAPASTVVPSSTIAPVSRPSSSTVAHHDARTNEAPLRDSDLFPDAEMFLRPEKLSDSETFPDTELPEVQPSVFMSWPTVTEKPVQIGPKDWTICISAPPPEWERQRMLAKEANGPHATYSIIVRVSPDAAASFRNGTTLPEGAVVVKEKHMINGLSGKSTFEAYAFMVKREAGYNDTSGDWEYAFVTLEPKRRVTRGRLAGCAKCHAKASEHDYLFRIPDADAN